MTLLVPTTFEAILTAIVVNIGFIHALSILVYHIRRIYVELPINAKPSNLQYLSIITLSVVFIAACFQITNANGLNMKFNI